MAAYVIRHNRKSGHKSLLNFFPMQTFAEPDKLLEAVVPRLWVGL